MFIILNNFSPYKIRRTLFFFFTSYSLFIFDRFSILVKILLENSFIHTKSSNENGLKLPIYFSRRGRGEKMPSLMPSLNIINFLRSPTDIEDIAHCKGGIHFFYTIFERFFPTFLRL